MLPSRFVTKIFIAFSCWVATHTVSAQCNDWEQLISYNKVLLGDMAHDNSGNSYVVGSYFGNDLTLGPYTFALPPDEVGAFIAKYDNSNSLVWAIAATDTDMAYAKHIAVTEDGNLIVAGDFFNTVTFGCLTWQGARFDVFVLKITPDGTPIWITGSTNSDDANINDMTMSANGNCIITSTFAEKSLVTPTLAAPDIKMGGVPVVTGAVSQLNAGLDSFVAAITPEGVVAWTHGIGGDGNAYDYAEAVTTDTKNNVIVTGYFNSEEISFDGQIVHAFTVSENYFLAKFDASGETLWVRETEGGNDQSGRGVAADADDNIFVSGRYYGNATFGSFTFLGKGEADAFLVKHSPEGVPLIARSIGNQGFDSGERIKVDKQDRVIASAYYYSNYLELGAFSSNKTDLTGSDSYVAILSNDLATVHCAKFATGPGEAYISSVRVDAVDNIMATFWLSTFGGNVNFDSRTFNSEDDWSVIAVLGDNPAIGDDDNPHPYSFSVQLGKDTTLCPGQKLTLAGPLLCNASYEWSTGQTSNVIEVSEPGTYSLKVVWDGKTTRDEITISTPEPLSINLGADKSFCPGVVIAWSLPLYPHAVYQWNNGGTTNFNSTTTGGIYWVEVSNRCERVRDSVTLKALPKPVVALGDDINACNQDVTLTYQASEDEQLLWSDGSSAPSLLVTHSGHYKLAVFNGCELVEDDINVTITRPDDIILPNVVTLNSDSKNDQFMLPAEAEVFSLSIFNRWGEEVFHANTYQNNWPTQEITSGIYYYMLKGSCVPESKGIIHVLH